MYRNRYLQHLQCHCLFGSDFSRLKEIHFVIVVCYDTKLHKSMSGRQPKQVTLFTFTYLGNQFKLLPNKVKCAKAGDFHFSWILFLIRKTQKGYVADVCMRDIEKRK